MRGGMMVDLFNGVLLLGKGSVAVYSMVCFY